MTGAVIFAGQLVALLVAVLVALLLCCALVFVGWLLWELAKCEWVALDLPDKAARDARSAAQPPSRQRARGAQAPTA